MSEPAPAEPAEPVEVSSPPSLLSGVFTVASLAFRESARNRVLHALVVAMLVVAGISYLFSWVSGGDIDPDRGHKIVADLSLSAMTLLGTIAAIFLGTHLIYQEVERRTIYTVLARPVGRTGFIVGKYLGLAGVMGAAVLAMGAGFLVIYMIGGGRPTGGLLVAIGFVYVELLVVTGVAILFSAAAHPIEGAVFAFVVAIAGHQTESLRDLAADLVKKDATFFHQAGEKLLTVAYVVFPNLENFNLRGLAAHGLPLPPAGHLAGALAYAAVYTAIMLALAGLAFRKRVL